MGLHCLETRHSPSATEGTQKGAAIVICTRVRESSAFSDIILLPEIERAAASLASFLGLPRPGLSSSPSACSSSCRCSRSSPTSTSPAVKRPGLLRDEQVGRIVNGFIC